MAVEETFDRPLGMGRKAALALEILWLYALVRWRLLRGDLRDGLAELRGSSAGEGEERHPALAYRLAWAVERVLGHLPFDSRCLVRSLVLIGLLARRSIPAMLVIGVRPGADFGAHAWVERDGRPLLPDGGAEFDRLVTL